ncbi:lycopene cyclase domain-containing protein [Mucilaginibacter xinganensis]|uniref:Lycopene cyclase domain-containing protein n=1 Tax=Mucilaginibacter xinganensis TaxID=1234841 RepID=A0A223P4G0_9SPHI|nr:lycopene cyclase domain-containing protein [Mucilaginibacter xinganensis]ASU36691.1 lycopene cyclase domain-containing protein [Mucilaginibacter xinganensis]
MKSTYLLIDLFSVLVPFIFSFHPRLKFYQRWQALFPAMIATGIIFIAWDMYFTHLKIWGFNSAYLTGAYIGNLPVEEVLFFLCIPYSCLFTYTCLNSMIKVSVSKKAQSIISLSLIGLSVFMAIRFHTLDYTCAAFAALAILIFTAQYILKVTWIFKFYVTYLVLLLPFLIVNGLLTGTGLESPIVWYNTAHIINLRILTIPFEDIFYGMGLILLNIMIYSGLSARVYQKRKSRRRSFINATNQSYTNANTIS